MAIIGMTGSGKSVLMARMLDTRHHFLVLKTKADSVKYQGARLVRTADAMRDERNNRLILAPRFDRQYAEFVRALEQVWRQGGWTVAIDELYYLDAELRVRVPVNRLLTQGREPGKISVVCGMQRPSMVTRFAIGEATHVICFAVEGRDAKILRDATNSRVAEECEALPRHHFVWFYRPERSIWTGKLNLSNGTFNGRIAA